MFETIRKLFTPVDSLTPDEAKDFMNQNPQGSYTLLDVRQPHEYEEGHIAGATLAPLPQLSDYYETLDKDKPVIVYCAIGGRSRVAAQMLAGKDFRQVYNLTGGIKSWNGSVAEGPLEMNMDLIRGDETPLEVIALAYTMERNLGKFYLVAQEKASDEKAKKLLAALASVEEKHSEFLIDMFQKLEHGSAPKETLDSLAVKARMEGGFDVETFLQKNAKYLDKVSDILDLAMMLETQALDLYIRFGSRIKNADSSVALNRIADEEKEHLKSLGNLRNQM